MAAPAGLPDLNTLDVFAYDDPDQPLLVNIVFDDDTHPRVIRDYVLDPVDWQPNNRGNNRGDGTGPPNGVNTVEGILGFDTDDMECVMCDQIGDLCSGQDCIDAAKANFEGVEDAQLIIREAQWGYGVFAWADIESGTIIGEYLGRLIPLDHVAPHQTLYTYTILDHANCDAQEYGNICRYLNHHCAGNTDSEVAMYGQRAVIVLRTNRFISAGEELTLDYGPDYFNAGFACQCDAFDYPHTSETYRRRVYPDGSVSPGGVGTFGTLRGKRSGGGRGKQAPSGAAGGSGVKSGRVERAQPKIRRRPSVDSDGVAQAQPKSMPRDDVSSPARRRRNSWGSMAYKGGDPDRSPVRRSARIAARGRKS